MHSTTGISTRARPRGRTAYGFGRRRLPVGGSARLSRSPPVGDEPEDDAVHKGRPRRRAAAQAERRGWHDARAGRPLRGKRAAGAHSSQLDSWRSCEFFDSAFYLRARCDHDRCRRSRLLRLFESKPKGLLRRKAKPAAEAPPLPTAAGAPPVLTLQQFGSAPRSTSATRRQARSRAGRRGQRRLARQAARGEGHREARRAARVPSSFEVAAGARREVRCRGRRRGERALEKLEFSCNGGHVVHAQLVGACKRAGRPAMVKTAAPAAGAEHPLAPTTPAAAVLRPGAGAALAQGRRRRRAAEARRRRAAGRAGAEAGGSGGGGGAAKAAGWCSRSRRCRGAAEARRRPRRAGRAASGGRFYDEQWREKRERRRRVDEIHALRARAVDGARPARRRRTPAALLRGLSSSGRRRCSGGGRRCCCAARRCAPSSPRSGRTSRMGSSRSRRRPTSPPTSACATACSTSSAATAAVAPPRRRGGVGADAPRGHRRRRRRRPPPLRRPPAAAAPPAAIEAPPVGMHPAQAASTRRRRGGGAQGDRPSRPLARRAPRRGEGGHDPLATPASSAPTRTSSREALAQELRSSTCRAASASSSST